MIRTLRAFFLSRLLREKILMVAFAVVGVLIWASSYSDRGARFWRQKNATTAELRNQKMWLDNRGKIEAAARKSAGQLDPGKTLDSNRLYAGVRQIAADNGVSNLSGFQQPPPVTNGQFSVNSLSFVATVGATKQEWDDLRKFYVALQDRAPYIGIDKFSLSVRNTPPQHILQLTVSSVEIAR